MIAGSHSRLATFEQCPRKLHLVNLTKAVVDPPSAVLDRGTQVHAMLAHAVGDEHAELPVEFPLAVEQITRLRREQFTLMVEREFAIDANRRPVEWFAPTVFYRFKIDVAAVRGSQGEVLDWKTGKVRVDQNQMRDYAIAMFLMFADIETVRARLVFLDQGQVVDAVYPRTALEPLYDILLTRMARLQAAATAQDWPATPSSACRWCPVMPDRCAHSQRR